MEFSTHDEVSLMHIWDMVRDAGHRSITPKYIEFATIDFTCKACMALYTDFKEQREGRLHYTALAFGFQILALGYPDLAGYGQRGWVHIVFRQRRHRHRTQLDITE